MNATAGAELEEAFEDNTKKRNEIRTNQAKMKVEVLKFKRETIENPSADPDERAHHEVLIKT